MKINIWAISWGLAMVAWGLCFFLPHKSDKDIEACAFAQGVKAVHEGIVNVDGSPHYGPFQPQKGDYEACARVGKEL